MMSDEYYIPLPLFLPPFPRVKHAENTVDGEMPPKSRQSDLSPPSLKPKVATGKEKHNKQRNLNLNQKEKMDNIEDEIGRLEYELSEFEYQDATQLAYLQYHHAHCAGKRTIRDSITRLENALCQVIQHHSHKLMIQNIITSKHPQLSSSSVSYGEAFDALLKPSHPFNQQNIQTVDNVVHNMEHWIGGCMKKNIPFADEIANIRIGDLVWVLCAMPTSSLSSSSSTSSSSSFLPSQPPGTLSADILRKQGWIKCVVVNVKSDLFFPRFIKVRQLGASKFLSDTDSDVKSFGFDSWLFEPFSRSIAQWVDVEAGILRIDTSSSRKSSTENTHSQFHQTPILSSKRKYGVFNNKSESSPFEIMDFGDTPNEDNHHNMCSQLEEELSPKDTNAIEETSVGTSPTIPTSLLNRNSVHEGTTNEIITKHRGGYTMRDGQKTVSSTSLDDFSTMLDPSYPKRMKLDETAKDVAVEAAITIIASENESNTSAVKAERPPVVKVTSTYQTALSTFTSTRPAISTSTVTITTTSTACSMSVPSSTVQMAPANEDASTRTAKPPVVVLPLASGATFRIGSKGKIVANNTSSS